MRRFSWIVITALSMTGCTPDRSKDVATCEMEAWRIFPKEPPRVLNDWASNFVRICMDAKGFDFELTAGGCPERPVATNGFCYKPRDPVSRWIDSIGRPKELN